MHRAMWGIDRVEEGERAEAAAILESVASRSIVWNRDGRLFRRWLSDDEVCIPLLFLSGSDADAWLRERVVEFMIASGNSRPQD